jgi:hypothetical protein
LHTTGKLHRVYPTAPHYGDRSEGIGYGIWGFVSLRAFVLFVFVGVCVWLLGCLVLCLFAHVLTCLMVCVVLCVCVVCVCSFIRLVSWLVGGSVCLFCLLSALARLLIQLVVCFCVCLFVCVCVCFLVWLFVCLCVCLCLLVGVHTGFVCFTCLYFLLIVRLASLDFTCMNFEFVSSCWADSLRPPPPAQNPYMSLCFRHCSVFVFPPVSRPLSFSLDFEEFGFHIYGY